MVTVTKEEPVAVKLSEYITFGALLLSVTLALWISITQMNHVTVAYDCRIVEISPDIPAEVKERCRRLMGKK